MSENSVQRKLAAILCADMVGYSRLMGVDEAGTRRRLNAHLRELIEPAIADRHGRIVKTIGDGLLVEFASVVDAVQCAVDIQTGMAARNANEPDDRRMDFRIGVNLGDIIVEGDDIHGDGVNVAARLEGLADPGGITVSGMVQESVHAKLDYGFEDLGLRQVKNIAEPVQTYRVLQDGRRSGRPAERTALSRWRVPAIAAAALIIVGGAIAWLYPWEPTVGPAGLAMPDKPSIAILPFKTFSEKQEDSYFTDGVINDIVTDLSKFRSLYVIAPDAVLPYKGNSPEIRQVSRNIGVRYVLTGSVQRGAERVRVNVNLIDGPTGKTVWTERFDEELTNIFDLQDTIVQKIVSALAVKVAMVEQKRALQKDTRNLKAYDHLLRGWAYFAQTTRATNLEARKMFEKALELEPRYAAALVGVGWTYRVEAGHGWTEFPADSLEKAFDIAQKALRIEESAAAHSLLGNIYLIWGEFDLAIKELDRAIELNPNDWNSYALKGSVLLFYGQPDKASEYMEKAHRFNPNMDPDRYFDLGLAYYLQARYKDAVSLLERNLGRHPDHVISHIPLAAAYARLGRAKDAAREADTIRNRFPFFRVDSFGTRFRRPEDQHKVALGLRSAGLE